MSVPAIWRPLQKRERAFWVALVCCLVSGCLAASGTASPLVAKVSGYLFVCSAPATVIVIFLMCTFRCPRCGKTYSVRFGPGRFPDRKPSSRHCLHCWLPKWSDPREEWYDWLDESEDW
jgi:hypothetical protein